ncbi:hypothetical protein AB1Y20_018764 [Prymnesium parvum]|uniref:Glycosyl transferase CAP10 domain-containing protein n=1 Tax=Prymnesium parvum TaxID=97485 RepID=A0AB34JSC2_PRYPA
MAEAEASLSRALRLCKLLRRAVDQHACSRDAPSSRIDAAAYAAAAQRARASRRTHVCPRCFGAGCAFQPSIERRLARTAQHGFDRRALLRAMASGVGLAHFRLSNRTVARVNVTKCTKPWRASRVAGFHQMLQDTAARFPLPETELLFSCGDRMASSPYRVFRLTGAIDEDTHGPLPAFTASPACDFSGNLPVPSFDYRADLSWSNLDSKMAKFRELSRLVRWGDKRPTLFWRGALRSTAQDADCPSPSSQFGRARLLNLTACTLRPRDASPPTNGTALFDVDATNLGGAFVSVARAEAYRYHACIEGDGFWSDRLGRMLFSGSLLFLQRYAMSCDEWFMLLARPWEHYIPVAPDFSDLVSKVQWARDHDNEALRIRNSQNALGHRLLNQRTITEFLATLIHCYAPLLGA